MTDNYLLDAIQRLTIPHTTRVLQTNAAGISCVTEVQHDPLLMTLRDAISGGVGRHATGGALGSERIPLDPGALELFDQIASQVNEWYLALPAPRAHEHIWTRLGNWYLDFENCRRAGKVPLESERETERLVCGWARRVENMFDPPIVFEITNIVDGRNVPVACPACGATRALDSSSGNQVTAVVLEYRNLGLETLDKATGLCRACDTVWQGRDAVRALRWEIGQDDAEAAPKAPAPEFCVSCYRSGHVDRPSLDSGARCACACHHEKEQAA